MYIMHILSHMYIMHREDDATVLKTFTPIILSRLLKIEYGNFEVGF